MFNWANYVQNTLLCIKNMYSYGSNNNARGIHNLFWASRLNHEHKQMNDNEKKSRLSAKWFL